MAESGVHQLVCIVFNSFGSTKKCCLTPRLWLTYNLYSCPRVAVTGLCVRKSVAGRLTHPNKILHHGCTGHDPSPSSYPVCGEASQSPIDIKPSSTVYSSQYTNFAFDNYDATPDHVAFSMINKGNAGETVHLVVDSIFCICTTIP